MKIIYIIVIGMILSVPLYAQWECPSALGANLKPIADSIPVSWGIELFSAGGLMTDKSYLQEMFFLGIDYTIGKHHFYAEGGGKLWLKNTKADNKILSNRNPGLRELFYNYSTEKTNLIVGFHSMVMDDHFILNERAYGVSYRHTMGKFKLNLSSGSVTKDFARNGTFCSKGFVYDVIKDLPRAQLGNAIGQSNFAGAVFTYDPQKIVEEPKPQKDSSEVEEDEFSSNDEFAGTDEFSTQNKESSKKPIISLDDVGAVIYDEFGEIFQNRRILAGVFATFELPAGFFILPEIIYQNNDSNNAVIYMINLYNEIEWENRQRSTISLYYYGKYDIDDEAKAFLSFSNIFAGEVLRMDAINMPFYQIDLKHSFMKYRLRLKLQYTKQIFDEKMEDLDFSISKKVGKNFDFIFVNSLFKAENLTKTNYMSKLEIRFTF
jgi:hypothetical protein